MNNKYALIAIFAIGCGGSEFTSMDYNGLEYDADSQSDVINDQSDAGSDSQYDSQPDIMIDSQSDIMIDSQSDAYCNPQQCPSTAFGEAICNAQGQCDIKCEIGCEKQGNNCYCPEPECCGNDQGCDPFGNPATVCKSGTCTTDVNASCDPAGCNLFCIHCYNDTFRGQCDGQCTCKQI